MLFRSLEGATVTLGGATSRTAVSASDGSYEFLNVKNGAYSITPSMSQYSFTPQQRSVNVNGHDMTGLDFRGDPLLPPVADFGATPSSGRIPLEVTFADLSAGNVTSWLWDFGDGGTSTARNPVHSYRKAGNYTVSLTAAGAGGSNTAVKTAYIAAHAAPRSIFRAAPVRGRSPLEVRFSDRSAGTITGWSWEFGDSYGSSERNPTHTYTSRGTYVVRLTVTGPAGTSTSMGRIRVR